MSSRLFMDETNTYKLRDLLKIRNGKDHKSLSDGTIPVFGSGGLMRYVDTYLYDKESILLPRKGTLSNIQWIEEPFWTVDTIYYTEINERLVDGYYLYSYLTNLDLSKLNSGTGVPSMTFDAYYEIEIILPKLTVQKAVSKVLKTLNSKIELNNRINAQLEAMAKTLYDYWFVQFDFPISAAQAASMGKPNLAGKPYKSSGGKMVWNEELKREIPEGWEVKGLFNVCNVQYGFPFSTNYFNSKGDGVPVIRIRDIIENSVSNYSTEENIGDKYLINQGDILIGMDGNFHINYWSKSGCYLNQRVVKLSETVLPNIYLKYQVEPYIKLREESVSRTTVGHLSDKDLKGIKVILPHKDLLNQTSLLYNGFLKKIVLNKNENQQLASLRDWLLPMLMNGQVTVGGSKVYDMPQQQVSMVAEQQALFDSSPIKQAVDLQLAMVLKALNRKKGDTMMQKDAYNLLALNGGKNPFLKAYNYVMNNFGTYSEQLKKDINNNPYIIKHTDGEKSYYWLNPETENEVKKALKAPENQEFVRLINWLKELYAKPFINNNFDRIELMNTVLKIVAEYQTKDPKKVYEVMKTWKVELGKYKTKAQKFTFKETETMLNLMINKGVVK